MLKTLGRETKGFRLVSVLTPIFMIAEVIMEMIIPKLMASIIDNGVTPGNMQVIYTVGAQMVVAALFGLLFGILGAVAAPFLVRLFRLETEPVAAGVAIGTSSHAIGTTAALQLGEVQGAMSSVSIGVAGLLTALLALVW